MSSTIPDLCRDAVIVIPGIMGSELVETSTGRTIWGLSSLGWYVDAWTSGESLRTLRVTQAELDGDRTRVTATRLLRAPAFAPVLRGVEPYRNLVKALRRAVAHADAILEFPYDWRLPVGESAAELATAAEQHLTQWQRHRDGSDESRLVLVAHSMGGLVAQHFTNLLGGADQVRTTVTLGTPFYGAAAAAYMLAAGRGAPVPLPHRRLRGLAVTLPAVYDLLPAYRCVDEGGTARRLTAGDVGGIGGDLHLAERSMSMHSRLADAATTPIESLIGVGQPTMQSIKLVDGTVEPCFHTCEADRDGGVVRMDRAGDSTVYRDSAGRPGHAMAYLPQTHSALAKSSEAIAYVRSVITQRPQGPPLGADVSERAVGVDVPDTVAAGAPFTISIRHDDPAAVSCWIRDAETEELETHLHVSRRGDGLAASAILHRTGLFRVEV